MADSNPSDATGGKTSPALMAFVDLKAQQARIRGAIDRAISEVLDAGAYIMGPQVTELERRLAEFCGAKHAIACSSGTDALLAALMTQGIGPGDGVICPAFTYSATPEVIALLRATPIFVDVCEDTFNLDPEALEEAIIEARSAGLKPKAVIPVDLFGQLADYDNILPIADKHGLFVLCDAAQGFGGSCPSGKAGQIGNATATSFFPAKPLGCYGDGGAIFTNDTRLAETMRSIILHGRGSHKYDIVQVGINGRLDTIQAAVLIEKLNIFPDEVEKRQAVARRYDAALADKVETPRVLPGHTSVWAQYTLKLPVGQRDAIANSLATHGVPAHVYYPTPLHQQPAYKKHFAPARGFQISERLSRRVLSLPMHPYLHADEQDRIAAAVLNALGELNASAAPPTRSIP